MSSSKASDRTTELTMSMNGFTVFGRRGPRASRGGGNAERKHVLPGQTGRVRLLRAGPLRQITFVVGGGDMLRCDPPIAAEPDRDEPEKDEPQAADSVFERWIQDGLESLYGDVLNEPLPPEMTELLRRYEQRLQNDDNGEKAESQDDAGER